MPLRGSGWSVEIKGAPKAYAAMAGVAEFGSRWNKQTVEEAAQSGKRAMQKDVKEWHTSKPRTGSDFPPDARVAPSSRRGDRPHLWKRIAAGGAKYRPGGAGGGGTWVAVFGVGGQFAAEKRHDPAWIHTFGSGVRGKPGYASGNLIQAKNGKRLTFMDGGQVWTGATQGQRAHEKYVDEGVIAARRVVTQRIASFGRGFRQARTIG